jgi:hypothetical protein
MTSLPFWASFEECVGKAAVVEAAKTQTRVREEPDQRMGSMSDPTRTKTSTREGADQVVGLQGVRSIPQEISGQTQTITKTREEQDQDPIRTSLPLVPRATSMNTQTVTEVGREDLDRDESARCVKVIPSAGYAEV